MRTRWMAAGVLTSVLWITPCTAQTLEARFLGFTPEGGWAAWERSAGELGRVQERGIAERESSPLDWPGAVFYAASSGFVIPPAEAFGKKLDRGVVLEASIEAGLGSPRSLSIWAIRNGDRVRGPKLPAIGEVQVGAFWRSPDRRSAVVEIVLGGRRSLLSLDLLGLESKLDTQAALAALRQGEIEVAVTLLESAITKAPGAGEPYYDLACLHALLGDLPRAQSELALALSIDRGRFARLATDDPDLDALRRSQDLWAALDLGD